MKREAPEPTLVPPPSARDHAQGTGDEPVTLVEYGDYECPHCARAFPIVKAVQERFGERLRFVFRNFPLRQVHANAENAAESAEAAGAQGKFWEMHDALFEHQEALGVEDLVAYAGEIAIDPDRVRSDLERHTFEPRVREDFMSGVRSGVNGTPTFFINGVRLDGSWEEEALVAAIEAAL